MNSGLMRLWQSSRFWTLLAAGIAGITAQVVPVLALWLGAENPKVQAFQHAADAIAALAVALGGILAKTTSDEDAAHKMALPPPARGRWAPPVEPTIHE